MKALCQKLVSPLALRGSPHLEPLLCVQRMPAYYSWYYYLNPFAYSLQGIVLSQLGDVTDLINLPDGGTVSVKDALAIVFGYHYDFLGYNILIMIVFSVVFIASGLVFLNKFKFQAR
jgi:hypothetical protein